MPGKNIRPLLGHPLIAYSIAAAKQSKLITRTIISTDDEAIATICRQYGAEVPFARPANISQDLSTDIEVFLHALQWLKENENYEPEYVVQLRPTSPVRLPNMIDECITKMMQNKAATSLRIVTPSPITPYKMWQIEEGNAQMKPLLVYDKIDEPFNQPRQILPKTYWQIGTLDIIKTSVITQENKMSGNTILHHIVENELAVDIDDIASFNKAAAVILSLNAIKP